jgi:acyl-ACP thioesterase
VSEGDRANTRTFTTGRRVFLGDASMSGRLRLDALAQFLQDLATNDAEDADDVVDDRGWILRRMELDIRRLPSIYEDLQLTTWCSGVGGRWAERSTTLADTREVFGGVCVAARAVWVYIDLATGTPLSLPANFFAVYGENPVRQGQRPVAASCAPAEAASSLGPSGSRTSTSSATSTTHLLVRGRGRAGHLAGRAPDREVRDRVPGRHRPR